MIFGRKKLTVPSAAEALPGRAERMQVPEVHFVLGTPLDEPLAPHLQQAVFGLGCFWGAERKFWKVPGVVSTAVVNTPGASQNLRSAPQKQPMPNMAVSSPAGNGAVSG